MTPDHSALIERLEAMGRSHRAHEIGLRKRLAAGDRSLSVQDTDNAARSAETCEKAASALRDLTEWRDIATHPSEGAFLVIGGKLQSELGGGNPCVEAIKVRYSPADDFQERETFDVVDACYYGLWVESPTHWLPLPSAPNQAKEAGE